MSIILILYIYCALWSRTYFLSIQLFFSTAQTGLIITQQNVTYKRTCLTSLYIFTVHCGAGHIFLALSSISALRKQDVCASKMSHGWRFRNVCVRYENLYLNAGENSLAENCTVNIYCYGRQAD